MRKHRRYWFVLPLCLTVLLSGCGFSSSKQTYHSITPVESSKPTEKSAITETEAKELLNELFELPEDIAPEEEPSGSSEMLILLNEKTICKINSIGTDTMELSITTPDLRALFMEHIDETTIVTDPVAESDRITQAVVARLQGSDCPMVTNEVTAELDLTGEEPEIVMTEELADAIYGNLLTLFDELMTK